MKLAFAVVFLGATWCRSACAQSSDADEVEAHSPPRVSARGIDDTTVDRARLEASPRQQTSELLSAAPGFFVDHEDGEGVANDVYLRGFDLDHGSGIEMRVGSIPINIPTHVAGQGYADPNFIIPEVVRAVHVSEGPFDPREGDAAIVGSASFMLGVPDRGYQLGTTFGSFGNARAVAIIAPRGMDDETFAAFAARHTSGFGQQRAASSASANLQYVLTLGKHDRLRLIGAAYDAEAQLPGVVRQDDVDAGRIAYDGMYPSGPGFFAGNQSALATRGIFGVALEHKTTAGLLVVSPWLMWTRDRTRQNYTGALETSQSDPLLAPEGDLFALENREAAAGANASFRTTRIAMGSAADLVLEPGTQLRAGTTDQSKNLLDPLTLASWDRRLDVNLHTLDAAAYVDADLRFFRRFHVMGGGRADALVVAADDHLTSASRTLDGVALSPRISAAYDVTSELTTSVSYGEGFRSLDVTSLLSTATPYSKVRSAEAGFRSKTHDGRFETTVALFETWVANELVFEPAAGGLTTENASVRRGAVTSFLARPWSWLLVSSAVSITRASFDTLVVGVGHEVPNVPPILFRTDATVRGAIFALHHHEVTGRIGVGYTFMAPRPLTDSVKEDANHILNLAAAARWRCVEVGVDMYNLLALHYADEAAAYVSNWSFRSGQQPASPAVHLTAATPLSVLATVTLRL